MIDVIPAIDIKDGFCVRLREGRMNDVTVFGDDPVVMSERWVSRGAERLHIVDLDGALSGCASNFSVIKRICDRHADKVRIQIGGGIRSIETISRYLDMGVSYVILGSVAVKDPGFVMDACVEFPGRVMVGIDAREGRVATDGWVEISEISAIELARNLSRETIRAVIYTDISRDGMLRGMNTESVIELSEAVQIPVIASGGLTSLDEIEELGRHPNIEAVIAGRSIYENTMDFGEALARGKFPPEG